MILNKSAVAVAIASSIAFSATAAEVYSEDGTTLKISGRVEARGNASDANDVDGSGNYADMSRVRINIEGESKLSDSASFYGRYENELKEDAGTSKASNSTRFMVTGIKTNVGDFYYGRHNNAATLVTDYTDIAEVYSGYINEYDQMTTDRTNGNLRYEMVSGGLTFNASLVNNDIADGAALAAGYDFDGGFSLSGAFTTSEQDFNGEDDADINTGLIGAKFQTGGFYAAAMVELGSVDYTGGSSDFTGFDSYIGFNFGQTKNSYHNVNMTYNYIEYDHDDFRNLDINHIGVEYAYNIKNVTAYAAYKLNMLDEDDYNAVDKMGDNVEDELMVGLKYKF